MGERVGKLRWGKWVGKGANWGRPQGDRDLKLPLWWAGEEWAHLEMGGEIAMGETGWGKGPIWANHKGDRDFKIAIVAGWERMGNWKWERVGKLRWGKMSGEKSARKLKRGQPKGDWVDLKIAIMDAG
ncbi:uncharacterized protein Gasu_61620 [Galdieria sulphuraria]|uniref:Uncharacterized protein n=1 Tax=Galdieria sulphuraria TaxID=130081 RepID=M2XRA3_GALSU|nr:uncharacterized protein Gasu_61620 [Galdieria sulphuraria]EME26193.1 hypothetical protein Gasu_61620 [Galdieria sulphuraria]|eukprot:XP_005702713.1 hypothetical protein Gasu_61620 [Galdieria sulphuraria]